MVRGPTLLGTAMSGLPVVFVRSMVLPSLIMLTVNVCCRLRPAAPSPLRDVIAGGTIGVPGETGLGEFAGAFNPLPAPAKPTGRPGLGKWVDNWESRTEDVGLKLEPEDYSGQRSLIVVDEDLINDRWVEWKVVRSIARLQKRIDVHDEGCAVWMIVADKSIEIGDVSGVIQGGYGRLPVARRNCVRRDGNQQTQHESCYRL